MPGSTWLSSVAESLPLFVNSEAVERCNLKLAHTLLLGGLRKLAGDPGR